MAAGAAECVVGGTLVSLAHVPNWDSQNSERELGTIGNLGLLITPSHSLFACGTLGSLASIMIPKQ